MKYLFYLSLLFFLSCFNHEKKQESLKVQPQNPMAFALCDSANIGLYLKEKSPGEVHDMFRTIVKSSNDSCTLLFLKTACDIYQAGFEKKYFDHLNAISCSFDGFITDYFFDLLPSFFEEKEDSFLRSLYETDKKQHGCLADLVRLYLHEYDTKGILKERIHVVSNSVSDSVFKTFLIELSK